MNKSFKKIKHFNTNSVIIEGKWRKKNDSYMTHAHKKLTSKNKNLGEFNLIKYFFKRIDEYHNDSE